MGLPVPGEPVMTFVGYLIGRNNGQAFFVWAVVAAMGTFVGSTLAYIIGLRLGERALVFVGKLAHISEDKLFKIEELFKERRIMLILFSRYVPGVRHLVPYLAGICRMNFFEYCIYNLAGAVIWCVSFIFMGTVLGENWILIEKLIRNFSLAVAVFGVFIFVVLKYFRKEMKLIFPAVFLILMSINSAGIAFQKLLNSVDIMVYHIVAEHISPRTTVLMKIISFSGSTLTVMILTLVILIFLWLKREYYFYGWMILFNIFANMAIIELLKLLFNRSRPDLLRLIEVSNSGFPSGHSMMACSFYGLLIYFMIGHYKHRSKYLVAGLGMILILLIGFSRIYLGVHYTSDVLAGFIGGLCWLYVFIVLIKRIEYTNREKTISKSFKNEGGK
ncbi:MAG: phosphatase PAP2 family protein [Peptococcaceae bacterium]|nr:phosphatase PAP2 family protein [Peptococcaceae bacterium]